MNTNRDLPFFGDLVDSPLSEEDFEFFKRRIFDLAGIFLSEKKRDLVSSRLRTHIQKQGLRSYAEYRRFLESISSEHTETQAFINLLTTNKTDFFREPQHFQYLESVVIPAWGSSKNESVVIWCCASSTGEEPYTLAMTLDHGLAPYPMNYKILATDIDTHVLARAENGVYPLSKLTEIPKEYQAPYVVLGKGRSDGWFKFRDELHSSVVFKHHNLNSASYPGDEKFDAIFCRNVLIYFHPDTIRTLMIKLHRSLKKDGLLFIGHSESIQGSSDLFKSLQPSIFRKI